MNAYIKLMDELVYFLTGGSLQTSTGPFVDCSSLGPLFYKRLPNGDILILFFLELFIKNFLSSTKWLLVAELMVERQNACLIPSLTSISFVHSFFSSSVNSGLFSTKCSSGSCYSRKDKIRKEVGFMKYNSCILKNCLCAK